MSEWKLLATGPFARDDLLVEFRDEMTELSPKLESEITTHWKSALAKAAEKGQRLFDGGLFQLEDIAGTRFQLSLTSYRRWTYASGLGDGANVSRPLASCAAVISADNRLLIQERSREVAEGAGLLHVPGGHPDPKRDLVDGLPDLFGAMEAELAEELALTPADLDPGRILAIIENLDNGKPELLFKYHCKLTSEEIVLRSMQSRDSYEYDTIIFLPAEEAKLAAYLAENEKRLAVPSQALLSILSEA
jgi:hypothetical protein